MKIFWTPRARTDFLAIASQIADYHSHRASKNWRKGIYEAIKSLEQFPHMGRMVQEKQQEDIREVLYRDYRIVYQLADNINILRIQHGRRLLRLIE